MAHKDGGPAFPEVTTNFDGMEPYVHSVGGMTLRQYYAGKALQGLCALPFKKPGDLAQVAVALADSLIVELNK